ncbi:hypothetical protein [Caulobacter sp. NIBR2454]|uniref:hypothetical protein n=1 Tax=Caulobacter sp. NIBR2454 TaxID=3015996 RepID=UPI0022B5F90C|nr:hypothetical protein [Caulobacter sp. NIBR2454]
MQQPTHPYQGVTLLSFQSAVVLAAVIGGLIWFTLLDGLTGPLILGAAVLVGFVVNAWVQFLLKVRSRSRASVRPAIDWPGC